MLHLLLLTTVFLVVQNGSAVSRIQVDPRTNHFVDEHGRVRMFRGLNSVIKHFPWYDEKLLDPKRQQEIKSFGFNVVRMGTMWTGVFPEEEGKVNQTYVDILEQLVTDFESLGVYTLMDMHQDVLWSAGDNGSGYWGVPPWIKERIPKTEHAFPWPLKEINEWACGYFTEEISKGFQAIYDNHNGTADAFADFWRTVAEVFASHEGVLGYELINEPWVGDIFADASRLLPGVAGFENLAPLYEKVNKAIRSVDDETILFWEPATWAYFLPVPPTPTIDDSLHNLLSQLTVLDLLPLLSLYCGEMQEIPKYGVPVDKPLGPLVDEWFRRWSLSRFGAENRLSFTEETPSVFGPGFQNVPGGDDYRNRTAMSWHYYCWAIGYGESEGQYDNVTRALCDYLLGPTVFATIDFRAKELGGSASMLTEFGICVPNATNPDSEGSIECNFVLEQTEGHFQSWTYWDTAGGGVFWNNDGSVNYDRVTEFVRPYPMATAGQPNNLLFDIKTKTFGYDFFPDVNQTMPTVMFIPELQYPGRQYHISHSAHLNMTVSEESEDIVLFYNQEGARADQLVYIEVYLTK